MIKTMKLDCLARWVISHFKNRAEMEASLGRMEKNHGKQFTDDLRRRMNIEMKNKRRIK